MKIILLSLYITTIVAVDLAITANNAIAHYENQMPESAIRAIEWRDAFSHKVHKHHNVLKLIDTKNYIELFKIYDSPTTSDEEKTRHMRLLVMLGQNTHNQELLHKIKEKIPNKMAAAIQYDFISLLQELMTKDNINTPIPPDPDTTPLMGAANFGSNACAQLLINAGAAINAQTTDGDTALYCAAYEGHAETVKLLLNAKADTDLKDNDQNDTPLMAAVSNGHIRCVQLLLKVGANINAQAANGATALYWAAHEGHAETMELLLKAKADTNLRHQAHNNTALMTAACNGHTHCVQLLIDADTNINAQNANGATALYYAAHEGHAEIMELLLKAKADTNLRHHAHNDTALMTAACNGHIHCVQLLLKAGANIHAQTTTGKTALHYAAQQGHVDIVHLLLKAGANINAQAATGRTALTLAAIGNHHETVELLLKAGADASQAMDTCIKNNEFDALKFIVAVQQKIIASAQQAS